MIQVIEQNNGVEKIVSIINSKVVEAYAKNQHEDDKLIDKALLYLKYQSNYEAFEEAYRSYLTKRLVCDFRKQA